VELSFGKVVWHTFQVCRNAWPLTLKQASAVADLRTELRNRFTDFKSNEKSMILLSTTLIVLIDDVPGNMEMEIIDLQCSDGRKKNTEIQGSWIYIANILTRTLFQQFIRTP
jgi:hypothetical protein